MVAHLDSELVCICTPLLSLSNVVNHYYRYHNMNKTYGESLKLVSMHPPLLSLWLSLVYFTTGAMYEQDIVTHL